MVRLFLYVPLAGHQFLTETNCFGQAMSVVSKLALYFIEWNFANFACNLLVYFVPTRLSVIPYLVKVNLLID